MKKDKENNEKEIFSNEIWCVIHKYAWKIMSWEIWDDWNKAGENVCENKKKEQWVDILKIPC